MEGFLDPMVLDDHYEMKHNKKVFKCRETDCQQFYNTSADLRAHIVLTHPSKIVVADNLMVRKIGPNKVLKVLKPKEIKSNSTSVTKQRPRFVVMTVKAENEGNTAASKEIKKENMDVEEEFENNTVHVEEVTLIENATIKMESEDQEEIESVESCSGVDTKEMEEENHLNDELPIPWLDEDLNLPTTFISSANASDTVVLKDAEDLDDLIQSRKTEYQLANTNIHNEILHEPKSVSLLASSSDLVKCLDCGEMMTVQKLLCEFLH
jgi:hypothetical protein